MKKIIILAVSAILTASAIQAQTDTTMRHKLRKTGTTKMPNTRPLRPMTDTPGRLPSQRPVKSSGLPNPTNTGTPTPTPVTTNKPVKM